jgi:hypothetical protein
MLIKEYDGSIHISGIFKKIVAFVIGFNVINSLLIITEEHLLNLN